MSEERFAFHFDPGFQVALFAVGVTPRTAWVSVSETSVEARFGPWVCHTERANVVESSLTGPYQWYKSIGVRLSFVDRGLTFGTTTRGGVCMRFAEPVPGIDPFGLQRHPGLTVTVADRDGLIAALST